MATDLDVFWSNVHVFIDIEARVSDSGDVNTISKFRNFMHCSLLENIRDLGQLTTIQPNLRIASHPFCKKRTATKKSEGIR